MSWILRIFAFANREDNYRMRLSDDFICQTRALMGGERFERYLHAFEEDTPVSIRLNPRKTVGMEVAEGEPVAWCRGGYYLRQRPNFTFDPLLHAGCYYVQEASSMFLDEVLRQLLPDRPVVMLDMCAAPGGKSTLAREALPEGSVLWSNEPVRTRANILLENILKWGGKDCIVTNSYPRDYRKAGLCFDVVLCDVPCSGEGMFRKDEATIGEWSLSQVEKCWRLQREIVGDAWECLVDGGLFIYSTCTFNTKENEENIRWMMQELGAEVLPVETEAEWGITGSLLEGFDAPVCRFIPGLVRGEGLFMCAMRKPSTGSSRLAKKAKGLPKGLCYLHPSPDGEERSVASACYPLSYQQAMAYLRREAIVLPPDAPRGILTVGFDGHPLGQVKNLGTRANNLYPKEWKIKTTHIPNDYEAILRHT